MIEGQRVRPHNHYKTGSGHYILYWMQASQRTEYNHALEYAVEKASAAHQPLVVFFGLTKEYPEANYRHYFFMLQGLKETQQKLADRGIRMVVQHGPPHENVLQVAEKASAAIVDSGYLKVQKEWRRRVAGRLQCPFLEVESDIIVPVRAASPKEEYAAATLRPKLLKRMTDYLSIPAEGRVTSGPLDIQTDSIDLTDIEKLISQLEIDRNVRPVLQRTGGSSAAKKLLAEFIGNELENYVHYHSDPSRDCTSHLSPYLHFGQISPLYVLHEISKSRHPGSEAFLEQLFVRRELAINFVHYNDRYDSFTSLPSWAQKTLLAHSSDPRPYLYSRYELENALTHDRYWNAAQKEMIETGAMHNYMRMYWGKKIIEWSSTPQEAFTTAVYLNNKYQLDGRDVNSYAGVAWCFGKHDRPWKERPVFGTVRYMNATGLERKFDMERYVASNL